MRLLERSDDLPWVAINDYLLELGEAQSKRGLFERAIRGLYRLIPYDSSAGVFDVERRVLHSDGMSQRARDDYNAYYRTVQLPFALPDGPAFPNPAFFSCDHFKYGEFAESEFYLDFARANGLEYALTAPEVGQGVILSPNRSRRGPVFTATDKRILRVLTAHLNNLCAIYDGVLSPVCDLPTEERIGGEHPELSDREREIAALLCRALRPQDIAARLFLSVRTVEVHIAHLYRKLGVRSRREAIDCLTRAPSSAAGRDRGTRPPHERAGAPSLAPGRSHHAAS